MLAAALFLAAACGFAPAPRPGVQPAYPFDSSAMTVVAAENFYGDLLHQIGGSRLKIYSFISDPNADPHEFGSNAANARAVADSRLVIENGLGYDAFLDRLLKASPSPLRVVINVQTLIAAQDGVNGHVWYDPTVMPRVARAAAEALQRLDAPHAPSYGDGLAAFLQGTQKVSDEVARLHGRLSGTPVAFTEPVYRYMADALGLVVKSPPEFMKAIEEGNDPPSRAVAEEQDLLRNHLVKVLIYNNQTETRVTKGVKDLAAGSGIPVVGVSETEPPGIDFATWQLAQLKALETAIER